MLALIDTSTSQCRLILVDGTKQNEYTWQADRDMARGLLGFVDERLGEHGLDVAEVDGWAAFTGPGSFTGLRIGISTINTLGYFLGKPIVGAAGDDWVETAISRLKSGADDKIILPEYGRPARITKPRK